MHGLEEKWGDHIDFVYLDIDDSRTQSFKRQLGYQYQPHIFLLDGEGNIVDQWVGLVDGQTLQAAFPQVLNQ
ncbi:MAG: TlpA family protein disulfide reductase [Anaerolineales bacterium]